MTKAAEARRRAVLLLGALAATLLIAGLLPWVSGGETTVRLMGLPLFLAGLMVSGAALRVHAAGKRVRSAPPVERGCDGCMCGQQPAGCDTRTALDESSAR